MPFPFVERPRLRFRPALVITPAIIDGKPPLIWTIMITSAANRGWPSDISIEKRFAECGLPVPSIIRTAKIAAAEAGATRPLGRLPDDLWAEVMQRVRGHIGLA